MYKFLLLFIATLTFNLSNAQVDFSNFVKCAASYTFEEGENNEYTFTNNSTSQITADPFGILTEPLLIQYEWDFGDGEFSTEKNPTHTFSKEGKFLVKLTMKTWLLPMFLCENTSVKIFDINSGTDPEPNCDSLVAGFNKEVAGITVLYTDSSASGTSDNIASRNWNFIGGTPSSASGPGPHLITYTAPGTYRTILNVVSESGCRSVKVDEVEVLTTGIQENKNNTLSLYPNPSQGYFIITDNTNTYTKASVLNTSGQKILEKEILMNQLDLRELKNGHYILQIQDYEGKTSHSRISIIK